MVARNTVEQYLFLGLYSQLFYKIGHVLLVLDWTSRIVNIAQMQDDIYVTAYDHIF